MATEQVLVELTVESTVVSGKIHQFFPPLMGVLRMALGSVTIE